MDLGGGDDGERGGPVDRSGVERAPLDLGAGRRLRPPARACHTHDGEAHSTSVRREGAPVDLGQVRDAVFGVGVVDWWVATASGQWLAAIIDVQAGLGQALAGAAASGEQVGCCDDHRPVSLSWVRVARSALWSRRSRR